MILQRRKQNSHVTMHAYAARALMLVLHGMQVQRKFETLGMKF